MTLGVAVATCCGATSLAAQTAKDPQDTQAWGLLGLRAGYCVRFLIESRAATRELRDGFRLLPAGQSRALHPALRQLIETQPEFASWTPSSLCFYYLDAVRVKDRNVAEKNVRKAQMIGVWKLGTVEQASGAQRDLVLDMYTNRGRLIRVAEGAQVRLQEAHSSVSDPEDNTEDTYRVKIGKTLLVWKGHPAGDSTRVDRPIEEFWSLTGLRRQGVWNATLALKPAWSRPLVGSLTVEGKDDLAKALKASPIRFVGPFYHGGGGELRFSR
jgi:hypothetical protein